MHHQDVLDAAQEQLLAHERQVVWVEVLILRHVKVHVLLMTVLERHEDPPSYGLDGISLDEVKAPSVPENHLEVRFGFKGSGDIAVKVNKLVPVDGSVQILVPEVWEVPDGLLPSESAGEHVRVLRKVDQAENLLYGHLLRAGGGDLLPPHALEQRYARLQKLAADAAHELGDVDGPLRMGAQVEELQEQFLLVVSDLNIDVF